MSLLINAFYYFRRVRDQIDLMRVEWRKKQAIAMFGQKQDDYLDHCGPLYVRYHKEALPNISLGRHAEIMPNLRPAQKLCWLKTDRQRRRSVWYGPTRLWTKSSVTQQRGEGWMAWAERGPQRWVPGRRKELKIGFASSDKSDFQFFLRASVTLSKRLNVTVYRHHKVAQPNHSSFTSITHLPEILTLNTGGI